MIGVPVDLVRINLVRINLVIPSRLEAVLLSGKMRHNLPSLAAVILFTLTVLVCHVSPSPSYKCACQELTNKKLKNKYCKSGEINAIDHRHRDVGLVGDCLPEVPDANKRVCYRTKVRNCDHLMQCTYRSRGENTNLTTLANSTIVRFKSPGKFEENKYRNNDFCIYNVSTSCKGMYIVVQTAVETSLNNTYNDSSGRLRCLDYLEFDFAPGHFLCGDELNNYISPPLSQNSFLAFFWSSRKGNKGRFEISVECTDVPPISSGGSDLN